MHPTGKGEYFGWCAAPGPYAAILADGNDSDAVDVTGRDALAASVQHVER